MLNATTSYHFLIGASSTNLYTAIFTYSDSICDSRTERSARAESYTLAKSFGLTTVRPSRDMVC